MHIVSKVGMSIYGIAFFALIIYLFKGGLIPWIIIAALFAGIILNLIGSIIKTKKVVQEEESSKL